MRNTQLAVLLAAFLGASSAAAQTAPTPNGIALPQGYKDWRVVSVSDRSDSHTMRVILGNDIAVAAARSGHTNPWPEGTVLGKVAWKETPDPNWQPATVPADLSHVEFMIKDSKKYSATGGLGLRALARNGPAALRQGRELCAGVLRLPRARQASGLRVHAPGGNALAEGPRA